MTAHDRHLNRAATVAGLTGLIPLPLFDTWAENRVRRAVTRRVLKESNVTLSRSDVAALSDIPGRSWGGLALALLAWPFKKVLHSVLFFFEIRRGLATRKDVVRRAAVLRESLAYGLLPGDTAAVRGRLDAP
ncbi:MAG: hypothetical protein H0V89_11925 [Deltaproteobacteria bacterium]|nr:hypothetical protein [Deltaproteobacteria bacterium]